MEAAARRLRRRCALRLVSLRRAAGAPAGGVVVHVSLPNLAGALCVWSLFAEALEHQRHAGHTKGEAIIALATDADNTTLITGDAGGGVKVRWFGASRSVGLVVGVPRRPPHAPAGPSRPLFGRCGASQALAPSSATAPHAAPPPRRRRRGTRPRRRRWKRRALQQRRRRRMRCERCTGGARARGGSG